MDYRRFVAYVYEYQQDEKQRNRGFVKVEIRDGQCYMSFHLRVEDCERVASKVYAFVREEEELLAILLGSSFMTEGKLEYLVSTESINIAGSGYTIAQIGGLLIENENHRQYATQWDDLPVRFSKVRIVDHKPEVQEEIQEKMQEQEIQEQEIQESMEEQDKQESQEDVQIESIQEELKIVQPYPVRLHTQGFHEIGKGWMSMQQEYERATPFSDGEIVDCIKISPEDVQKLQHQDWVLGNNSFMQHGYQNYSHLILGRCSQREGYILGVPGVFDHQERFMASMFGFPYFKAAKGAKACMGQFGYWYRVLE